MKFPLHMNIQLAILCWKQMHLIKTSHTSWNKTSFLSHLKGNLTTEIIWKTCNIVLYFVAEMLAWLGKYVSNWLFILLLCFSWWYLVFVWNKRILFKLFGRRRRKNFDLSWGNIWTACFCFKSYLRYIVCIGYKVWVATTGTQFGLVIHLD